MPAAAITVNLQTATRLYESVKDYLEIASPATSVVFGWRERAKQMNQATAPARAGRVCFVPGDDKGKAGLYGGPQVYALPRRVRTRYELIAVEIWAHDPTAPQDEAKQYDATIALEDLVVNAIHNHISGYYELSDPEWVVSPTEKLFGKARIVYVTLEVPILRRHSAAAALPAVPTGTATAEVTETVEFADSEFTELPPEE